jgi:cyclopropane fatty-acyl-phospholipid synthase-like methyltransferase
LDIWKYFAIGHTDHHFMNPLSEAKFDEIVEMLRLPAGARVLDIACGKAPLLLRIANRWDCSGVGVEISPPFIEDARRNVEAAGLSDRIELSHTGGAQYEADPESFDLACCIGASWIWEGHEGTLRALASWVRPGGLVLVGQPYWRVEPSESYLATSEFERDSLVSHAETAEVGAAVGLTHLHSIVSSEDDWDRYEGLQWNAALRYAHEHPDDPDSEELRERNQKYRESYLRGGRDELGWALYLYLRS